MPFVSIGTGATRWFTQRARTTTSAPSSVSSSVKDRTRAPRSSRATATAAARPRPPPLDVDHHRELVVLDDDELRRVVGLTDRVGHDDGDQLADEPDDVACERISREHPASSPSSSSSSSASTVPDGSGARSQVVRAVGRRDPGARRAASRSTASIARAA